MRHLAVAGLLFALLVRPAPVRAQPAAPAAPAPAAPAPARKLVVGTKAAPPFVIKNPDGSWSGISIDLWRHLAAELHLDYELRELEVKDLLAGLGDHSLDVVVSLTLTAERESSFDFTHPFYSTGLSIGVVPHAHGGIWATAKQIFTLKLLLAVLALIGILFAFGALIWLVERRRNASEFAAHPLQGIGAGFWWSVSTMTTVGDDKSPRTVLGRVLALLWMFLGVVLISSFTGSISAALTVSQLESPIHGPEDLPRYRVATVSTSPSARYLERRGIAYRGFASPLEAMQAVVDGKADAVVYESPILRYLAKTELGGALTILPVTFEHHGYGFGLPSQSPLTEPLDQKILEYTIQDDWESLLLRYLGAS